MKSLIAMLNMVAVTIISLTLDDQDKSSSVGAAETGGCNARQIVELVHL